MRRRFLIAGAVAALLALALLGFVLQTTTRLTERSA
jgi:hypothetical protein